MGDGGGGVRVISGLSQASLMGGGGGTANESKPLPSATAVPGKRGSPSSFLLCLPAPPSSIAPPLPQVVFRAFINVGDVRGSLALAAATAARIQQRYGEEAAAWLRAAGTARLPPQLGSPETGEVDEEEEWDRSGFARGIVNTWRAGMAPGEHHLRRRGLLLMGGGSSSAGGALDGSSAGSSDDPCAAAVRWGMRVETLRRSLSHTLLPSPFLRRSPTRASRCRACSAPRCPSPTSTCPSQAAATGRCA